MKEASVEPNRVYEDFVSARKDNRPDLELCRKALQPGNTLVVWQLDRLGRNLKDLINFVEDLNHGSIGLKVLTGEEQTLILQLQTVSWFLKYLLPWQILRLGL